MKKGFTLIELLAVIVIIALITLITVPVIGNIIENSKKEAFKRSVEGLAREYEYREVQTDSKLGNIDACALQDSGTTCNIRGTIDRDDDGDIIVDVENGKYTAKGKIGEMTVTNCDESVGGENQGSGQGSGENNNNENNNENNNGNSSGNNGNNNGNNNSGNENNETNQNTPTPDLINISSATIDPIEAVNYDGTAKTPNVVVKYNNVLLTQNTDYIVAYSNNINVGTATVLVTGIGNYTGTKTASFTIKEAAKNISGATIDPIEAVDYDGTAKTPIVIVKYNNVPLTQNTDYTVAYSNNINVGTAIVTITGIGNYTGTKDTTFVINGINPPNTSVVPETNLTYNGLEQSLIKSTDINGDVYYNVGTALNSSNYLSSGNTTKPKRVDAGTYTVYYYVPANGNYNEVKGSVTSKINPKTLYAPYGGSSEYIGSTQNSGITCPTGSTAGGTMQAIEIGTYTQTCTLNNSNYKWYGTNNSTVNINWEISLPSIGPNYFSSIAYDYYAGEPVTINDFTTDYRILGKTFYGYYIDEVETGEYKYNFSSIAVCGNENGQRFCISAEDNAFDYAYDFLPEIFSNNCYGYPNYNGGGDMSCTGNDVNVSISTSTGIADVTITNRSNNQYVNCYSSMEEGIKSCY